MLVELLADYVKKLFHWRAGIHAPVLLVDRLIPLHIINIAVDLHLFALRLQKPEVVASCSGFREAEASVIDREYDVVSRCLNCLNRVLKVLVVLLLAAPSFPLVLHLLTNI